MKTIHPFLLTDFYKIDHKSQYPENTTVVYSNFTPRKSRIKDIKEVVFFGLQYFIKEYLIDGFKEFFAMPEEEAIAEYKRMIDNTLGKDTVDIENIREVHRLGYLPLKIKALPEGTRCPIGVPMMTIVNTHPKFSWLTNFIESVMSTIIWMPITSATIAAEYRRILDNYAKITVGNTDFVQWQAHDFSFRGMAGVEACMLSGAAHLLSFTGTDTIPAIYFLEKYYQANVEKEIVGSSVVATEHAIMMAGEKENERETYRRLIEDVYPNGILSIVSDTWNLWNVLTEILPSLKKSIMARDGKIVVRPDSGDPVEIICGVEYEDYTDACDCLQECIGCVKDDTIDKVTNETPHGQYGVDEVSTIFLYQGEFYRAKVSIGWNRHDKQFYYIEHYDTSIDVKKYCRTPAEKGVVELLWEEFGGVQNEYGYKVLDSHVGAIYGDSITTERALKICRRLEKKGFASTNVVLGVGSYSYQYNTRDTFGMAMKATYCEVDGEPRAIFKDPITDDGTKKSHKGLLTVTREEGKLKVTDQVGWEQEQQGELKTVFEDGELIVNWTLGEIRERVKSHA